MIYTTAKQDYHTKVLTQTAFALTASDYKDPPTITRTGGVEMETAVRRLTPKECERLQDFPDDWTLIGEPVAKYDQDGNVTEIEYWYTDTTGKRRKVTDSARYKALGNSIALPFWRYLARRIVAQYEHEVTMGSLFDGIGGFPYVFRQCGAVPVWASEIEEFCIAVTKEHFPDDTSEQQEETQCD